MNYLEIIFQKIKIKPMPAILGILGMLVSPLINYVLSSFVNWLALAPSINISTLLIIIIILSIFSIVLLIYLFSFVKEVSNPFDRYQFNEETNTCIDIKTGKRYCPTGISSNEKHPVKMENGEWICSNKNCKNSFSRTIGYQP